MIDRLSTFSDPEIIKLINENFIPVAENDWYQRRRDDAVGKFFRSVADQGPRKGEGGSTRQGHYTLTAGGKLLGYNNNRGAGKHREMIDAALKKWNALPAAERKAGAMDVSKLDASKLDQKYARLMPEGTVVLKSYSRLLTEDAGEFRAIKKAENSHGSGHLAAHNQMWLQAEEIDQLRGLADGADLPKPVAFRLMRFHLLDNTRGEPAYWSRDEVSDYKVTVSVPKGQPLRRVISGSFLLRHGEARGFDAKISGYVDLAPKTATLTAVKLVALGDHWGSGPFTKGARPGKAPLGIAFSLAEKEDPAFRVPPQGSHWLQGYFEADRH